MDVGEITGTENAGEDCAHNHGVGGRIFQPNWLVLNIINDLAARDVSAASDLGSAKSKEVGNGKERCERQRSGAGFVK